MHMKIRAIVYAETPEAAMFKAQGIFSQLCSDQRPFDYFQMFGPESLEPNDKFPAVALATSDIGKRLIMDGWAFTERDFYWAVDHIRAALAAAESDEDLITRRNEFDFRFYCYEAGQYNGSCVWLYDNDGEGIRSPEHLQDTLNKWQTLYEAEGKPNPYANLSVWVVPADVHY